MVEDGGEGEEGAGELGGGEKAGAEGVEVAERREVCLKGVVGGDAAGEGFGGEVVLAGEVGEGEGGVEEIGEEGGVLGGGGGGGGGDGEGGGGHDGDNVRRLRGLSRGLFG